MALWPFNKEFGFWDEWRGHSDGTPVFFSRTIFRFKGWKIGIHSMVHPDMEACFHSHPAIATRFVFWGGYTEEIYSEDIKISIMNDVKPMSVSKIVPNMVHRIHEITNGKTSYTLWIRRPITHKVRLVGSGWSKL